MFCTSCEAAIIYLHSRVLPLLRLALESSPTKFGFLAYGVYLVPLSRFPLRLRHCGTFIDFIHDFRFRISSAVSFLPGFIFSSSIISTVITDGASMDFPLTCASDCPSVMLFAIDFLFQFCQTFQQIDLIDRRFCSSANIQSTLRFDQFCLILRIDSL